MIALLEPGQFDLMMYSKGMECRPGKFHQPWKQVKKRGALPLPLFMLFFVDLESSGY